MEKNEARQKMLAKNTKANIREFEERKLKADKLCKKRKRKINDKTFTCNALCRLF